MKKCQIKKGFTLLELLVVMGIIAVLIALGAVSYASAQKKARDAKRLGDLKAIQNAMEQYYSVCTDNPNTYKIAAGDLTGDLTCTTPSTTFITFPTDPLGGNYQCVTNAKTGATCGSSAYTICPPASVNAGQMLETKNCSDQSCCVTNSQ